MNYSQNENCAWISKSSTEKKQQISWILSMFFLFVLTVYSSITISSLFVYLPGHWFASLCLILLWNSRRSLYYFSSVALVMFIVSFARNDFKFSPWISRFIFYFFFFLCFYSLFLLLSMKKREKLCCLHELLFVCCRRHRQTLYVTVFYCVFSKILSFFSRLFDSFLKLVRLAFFSFSLFVTFELCAN